MVTFRVYVKEEADPEAGEGSRLTGVETPFRKRVNFAVRSA
jgi:hypothetical protein